MRNKKTNEVTEGVMLFANALINDHFADPIDVYERVAAACFAKAGMLKGLDPERNR